MSRIIAALALLFSLALTQEAMAVEKQYLTLELDESATATGGFVRIRSEA